MWQLCHIESLQSPEYLVTDAGLRTAIKETHCMMKLRHTKTHNVMDIGHTIYSSLMQKRIWHFVNSSLTTI